jgi:hypothetical protein
MRKTLKLILFIIVFCQAARFSKSKTDGFAMVKISSPLAYAPQWDFPCPDLSTLKNILIQPFFYLGKGVQTFVFESEDGEYVIKLIRHDHLRPAPWTPLLPRKWAQPKIEKKHKKQIKDFTSYKIAYEEFREETGLLFLHLNQTDYLKQKVKLVDKIGIAHTLDLDQYAFLVQKKAELTYPALQTLIDQKKTEEAKAALSSLVSLLAKRFEKGIFDKDPDLNTNFGFIEDKAIQIDFGRFQKPFPSSAVRNKKEAIRLITDHLHQWLMTRSPDLDQHLKNTIESLNES